MDQARQDLKQMFDDYHLDFDITPLLFFVESIESFDTCLVLLNNTYYSFADPLEAIEFCFQAHKAFQIPFPEITRHIWAFIQKSVYTIRLDRSVTCANTLWSKVRKLMKESAENASAA